MVTMREVAEAAQVSYTTVSFVLNGRHDTMRISEETRRQVLETAERLGYHRNEMARTVASGKSQMLGFLTIRAEYEPFSRMLLGAIEEAESQGYTLKVLRADADTIKQQFHRCLELRLVGVVVLLGYQANLAMIAREIEQHKLPVAYLEEGAPQPHTVHVLADEAAGSALVIQHLVDFGHRKIAYIAGDPQTAVGALRERHFREHMDLRGLSLPPEYVVHTDWSDEGAAAAAKSLLNPQSGLPTAICCASDEFAMTTCRVLRRAGLRVPEDVSVVGYSDLAMSRLFDPPLTTVVSPFEEMGRISVRNLLKVVDGPGNPVPTPKEVVRVQLVARESSGPTRKMEFIDCAAPS